MRPFTIVSTVLAVAAIGAGAYRCAVGYPLVPNPDPNHTHADFAVWVNGEKLDFSGNEFMSGLSTDETTYDEEGEAHHKHLHLHDGNGDVVHRHKPELTLDEFFASIGWQTHFLSEETPEGMSADWCLYKAESRLSDAECDSGSIRLFVNGVEYISQAGPLSYEFNDGDHLLITDATDPEEVQRQLTTVTDESCLYSRTCPFRGSPPTENCVADPEVPCVQ
jgi:hypothetical protein